MLHRLWEWLFVALLLAPWMLMLVMPTVALAMWVYGLG